MSHQHSSPALVAMRAFQREHGIRGHVYIDRQRSRWLAVLETDATLLKLDMRMTGHIPPGIPDVLLQLARHGDRFFKDGASPALADSIPWGALKELVGTPAAMQLLAAYRSARGIPQERSGELLDKG